MISCLFHSAIWVFLQATNSININMEMDYNEAVCLLLSVLCPMSGLRTNYSIYRLYGSAYTRLEELP